MDVTAAAERAARAHLEAHGAERWPAPSVHYHNRRVTVYYTGGPSAESTEAALAGLVESIRTLDGVEVVRTAVWSCGAHHLDEVEAWSEHEGKERLEPHYDCGGGCGESDYVDDSEPERCLSLEALREVLATPGGFTSSCKPLPATDA